MVGTVVIKRVFNNNVAMVTSDDGSELIVIGRGLCFGRHAGDAVDEASIEKPTRCRRELLRIRVRLTAWHIFWSPSPPSTS